MPKTILIVENDVLSMKLLNALLQYNGYDTINSIDGSNILAIAQERSLDLIIMDIKLPVLSGLELTRMLKRDEELKKNSHHRGYGPCHDRG